MCPSLGLTLEPKMTDMIIEPYLIHHQKKTDVLNIMLGKVAKVGAGKKEGNGLMVKSLQLSQVATKMMKEQVLVPDGQDHLSGHLAAVMAKWLLLCREIVAVHCEGINISASLCVNKLPALSLKADEQQPFPRPLPLMNPGSNFCHDV